MEYEQLIYLKNILNLQGDIILIMDPVNPLSQNCATRNQTTQLSSCDKAKAYQKQRLGHLQAPFLPSGSSTGPGLDLARIISLGIPEGG